MCGGDIIIVFLVLVHQHRSCKKVVWHKSQTGIYVYELFGWIEEVIDQRAPAQLESATATIFTTEATFIVEVTYVDFFVACVHMTVNWLLLLLMLKSKAVRSSDVTYLLLILLMREIHKARTRSRQTPLSWAPLAAVSHVNPAAFSSLQFPSSCLGLPLLLCPMLTQQPSVPSVLGSPCCCVPC